MSQYAGQLRAHYRRGGLEIAETSYHAGQRVSAHAHDRPLIIVVLSGSMREHVRGRTVHGAPGNVLFHPPGELHRHAFEQSGSRCLGLQMDARWLERLEVEDGGLPAGPVNGVGQYLAEAARLLYVEFRRGPDALSAALDGLALTLLASLSRSTILSDGARPQFFDRVLERLHDDVAGDLDLASLARIAQVSPEHLARTFRRRKGVTIGQYVRALRVERAQVALAAGEPSLARLALQLGFYDQAHFTRVFKAHVGCTPGEYRRSMAAA